MNYDRRVKLFFPIPNEVAGVSKRLRDAGFEAYLVGGCVRDLLLGRKPVDWDITTNATPEEIMSCFQNTFYTNDFGTVGVVSETADESLKVIQITPYRIEKGYSDRRRPDEVVWSKKLEDDLARRDFTINALALSLAEKKGNEWATEIVDLFGGLKDLRHGIIKAVGNPDERFGEDALRIMRAVRLSAELEFSIENETFSALEKHRKSLKDISAERVRDEFIRIIMSPHPMAAFETLKISGILEIILPEILEGSGMEQNAAHSFDVYEHIMRTLDHAAKKNFPLDVRLAALFHDIGKPRTRAWSDKTKQWTFYGHDVVGARMTKKIMERMKFPTKMIETVVKLVRWHMFFSDTEAITLSAVRRMVANVGKDHIWELMDVRVADRIGTGRPKESPYRLRKYRSMVEEAMRDPISVSMLKINGEKIMKVGNITPGPIIGLVLSALLEEVLEDPKKNTEEYLEKRAVELIKMPELDLKKLGAMAKEKKENIEETEIAKIRGKHGVK
jgi:poly(A) polymerase/tRNA nucleotidyltransferase (CCA-adding enzyme)